jgi:hypothetical protein
VSEITSPVRVDSSVFDPYPGIGKKFFFPEPVEIEHRIYPPLNL